MGILKLNEPSVLPSWRTDEDLVKLNAKATALAASMLALTNALEEQRQTLRECELRLEEAELGQVLGRVDAKAVARAQQARAAAQQAVDATTHDLESTRRAKDLLMRELGPVERAAKARVATQLCARQRTAVVAFGRALRAAAEANDALLKVEEHVAGEFPPDLRWASSHLQTTIGFHLPPGGPAYRSECVWPELYEPDHEAINRVRGHSSLTRYEWWRKILLEAGYPV